ncbi:MAG TPA: hypothetical protein DCS55_04055 [Acidimicrobiaceae bacterium]|nr:hypothetical protein [Acidimicrobiaceae bacterium]
MEDTELLEALDRRARRAVTALDAGLVDAQPAPRPVEAGRSRRRPWVPLLVAAALIVVALVGIGLSLDARDDERGTVADRDVPVETGADVTRLSLADPAALGYEVRAAFGPDTARHPGDPDPLELHWMAHLPEGADAADAPIVLTGVLPSGANDFPGEVVQLGGAEGILRVLGPQVQLSWPTGDQVRLLSSVHLEADGLVAIGRAAVEQGWDGSAALPGHVLLHQGPIADFSPMLAYAGSGPTGRSGIAYDHASDERDLVIGWGSGPDPQARWEARRTMGTETELFQVRGRSAHHNRIGPGSEGELSWLEADGTLVEVVFHGDPADIVPLLDAHLTPITEAEHERVLADLPPDPDHPLLDFPDERFDPISEAPSVAELLAESPATRARVAITSHELSALDLVMEVEAGNGTSGSGYPLRDLRTPAVQLMWLGEPGSGFALGGVVPPGTDVQRVTITDRSTGESLTPEQVSTGGIAGSDHVLFIALVTDVKGDVRIDVTFQTDGGERTWRF